MTEIPEHLLKDLLVDSVAYLGSNLKHEVHSKFGRDDDKGDDGAKGGAMRIVHVKPAGDVVHVFSHIRKTYRVQWVLLKGGGNEPPRLQRRSGSSATEKAKAVRKGKHRKRPETSEDSEVESATISDVQWVPLDRVEHAKYVKISNSPPINIDYYDQHWNGRDESMEVGSGAVVIKRPLEIHKGNY